MAGRDKKRKITNSEIIKALAMVTQIGMAMFVCVGIGLAFGMWLDKVFGTGYWTIVFLFIGILAGIRSLFVIAGKQIPGYKTPFSANENKAEDADKADSLSGSEAGDDEDGDM